MQRRILAMRVLARIAALVCLAFVSQAFCSRAFAQQAAASRPLMLVTWFGTGAIALPSGPDWKPQMITVYNNITRPVAQYGKGGTGGHIGTFQGLAPPRHPVL